MPKTSKTPQLQASDDPRLEAGDDIVANALEEADDVLLSAKAGAEAEETEASEVEASNNLAETLQSLQNIIERNANELSRIKGTIKEKRESLKNVFDNDASLSEAEEKAKEVSLAVKQQKATISSSPQAAQLRTDIGELREQQLEIEDTLSNHLLNYYTLTNSTSFDTSDGDQWEFKIRAQVKAKKD